MWAGQQRVDSPLSKPRGKGLKKCSGRSQPRVTRTEVQATVVDLVDGGPWGGEVSRPVNYTTSPSNLKACHVKGRHQSLLLLLATALQYKSTQNEHSAGAQILSSRSFPVAVQY